MPRKKEDNSKPCETITLNGKTLDLYYIGTLAEHLGRSSQTVRKWELGGVIPRTIFIKKGTIRMYSMEQINILVKCAEEAKLKQGSSTKRFQELAKEKIEKYHKKISKIAK